MEQPTSSKLEREYVKAVYCHPAYFTSMQDTPGKMQGWMKHKLGSDCWEKYTALTYSLSNLELVSCSISGSKCYFLTCIQVSQETGKVIWNSHYFKNFPQFVVIHTVKGLPQSMKQKWMFFWNSLAFPMIQRMLALCSLVPLSFFSKSSLYIWKFLFHVLLRPSLKDFEHNLTSV